MPIYDNALGSVPEFSWKRVAAIWQCVRQSFDIASTPC